MSRRLLRLAPDEVLRRGSLRLYLVEDLERWLTDNARHTLEKGQR